MRVRFPIGRHGSARFPSFVLGAAVASLAWLIGVMVTVTSPDDAVRERASPSLPPATAALSRQVLQQVVWNECTRTEKRVAVTAPAVPPGYRPVVTQVSRDGTAAATGTVLARFAGRSLIAVVTAAVLYRDLAVGDTGADVRALEEALDRAGLIRSADATLDAATLAAWSRLGAEDGAARADRIRVADVVTVPPRGSVAGVEVRVGDTAARGSTLLVVTAVDRDFTCALDGPTDQVTVASTRFEVAGRAVAVAALSTREGDEGALSEAVVRPARRVSGSQGRLGVGFTGTEPALAAPLAAVKVAADGSNHVVVVRDRSSRDVGVTLGATAQGLVEVRGEGLREGDQLQLFSPDQTVPPDRTGQLGTTP
ncbi:MAG: hypothetical protein NTV23_05835 [Propionibacteriales bacterium]|nr:hypothetical protein [Propionibacteriales bacterium]